MEDGETQMRVDLCLNPKQFAAGAVPRLFPSLRGLLRKHHLVHLYRKVDYPLLYKTIVEELDTFDEFVERLFCHLDL